MQLRHFCYLIPVLFGFFSCVQKKHEKSKQNSTQGNEQSIVESSSTCGKIPVSKSMSLQKRIVNGFKFWTTGFDLISLEAGTNLATQEESKSSSGFSKPKNLGTMEEPAMSSQRTFQMLDVNKKLVAEGSEAFLSLVKEIDVYDCQKTYLGKIANFTGTALQNIADQMANALAEKAFKAAVLTTPVGAIAVSGASALSLLSQTKSLFMIFDKDNKIIGFIRKKERLDTDYVIEEIFENVDRADNVDGLESKSSSKVTPSPPKETWRIHRKPFEGGFLDNWQITVKEESKLDYRMILMLPAFKTDKDATLPGSFDL
jgi:hypothetical protein